MSTKMKAHLLVDQFPWLARVLTILVAYGVYKLLSFISMDIVGAIALVAIGAFALHILHAYTRKPNEDEGFDDSDEELVVTFPRREKTPNDNHVVH